MTKLQKQIAVIVSIVLVFALFNASVFFLFTYRVLPRYSEDMQAKSVSLAEYLPFDESSKIVKLDSEMKLSGELPVIDGAAALYPVFSAFVNAVYPEDSIKWSGEDFEAESALQYRNTRGAYKAIVDGDIDIAILASPSEGQLAYAAENGVELEFIPIGRDAFVFLVGKNNPVDGLTSDEIRGIYSGEYQNWKELGGDDSRIGALTRNEGSGSQSSFLNFMGDTPVKKDYDGFLGRSIGFSFRYYVEDVVSEGNVKMLALDGVYPDIEHIRNGEYPLVGEFYAVIRKGETNPNVKAFVDWMLSPEGQRIIEETGYVGIEN